MHKHTGRYTSEEAGVLHPSILTRKTAILVICFRAFWLFFGYPSPLNHSSHTNNNNKWFGAGWFKQVRVIINQLITVHKCFSSPPVRPFQFSSLYPEQRPDSFVPRSLRYFIAFRRRTAGVDERINKICQRFSNKIPSNPLLVLPYDQGVGFPSFLSFFINGRAAAVNDDDSLAVAVAAAAVDSDGAECSLQQLVGGWCWWWWLCKCAELSKQKEQELI